MPGAVGGPTEPSPFHAIPLSQTEAEPTAHIAKPQPLGETSQKFHAKLGPPESDANATTANQIARKAISQGWIKA